MIVFNFNHTDYKMLLADFATTLKIPYKGEDYLSINPPHGKGIIKVLGLFNELQVMMADFTLKQPLKTIRAKSDDRYFVLHFDDFYINKPIRFGLDDEMLQKSETHHAVARITSTAFENSEEIPANTRVKSIKILFGEKWLKRYLGLNSNNEVLQKYITLKTGSFDLQKLDVQYNRLLNSLWQVEKTEPLHNIFLQNRVTLLMERFFMHLTEKVHLLDGKFTLSPEDINRLVEVEKLLSTDFSKNPPTIDYFSKMVSMSSTVLKKKFKGRYGSSIYAYYQKLRMNKAKGLLETGDYKVKDIAEAVGYANTSNFITAFKKEFQHSPGEALKILET